MRAIVVEPNALIGAAVCEVVARTLPGIELRCTARLDVAGAALRACPDALLVSSLSVPEGDVLSFFCEMRQSQSRPARIIVVSAIKELYVLAKLRDLEVAGLYDPSTDDVRGMEKAIRLVVEGASYWSPRAFGVLVEYLGTASHLTRSLTPKEQLVLAAIGDGSDDDEAAARLGSTAAAVLSMRRKLHRKLNVRHKGQLIRLAVQMGYVRFSPLGIERPGYAQLAAACPASDGRRGAPSAPTEDHMRRYAM